MERLVIVVVAAHRRRHRSMGNRHDRGICQSTQRRMSVTGVSYFVSQGGTQSINQSRDAQASLEYPDRCLCRDGRPSTPVLCNVHSTQPLEDVCYTKVLQSGELELSLWLNTTLLG